VLLELRVLRLYGVTAMQHCGIRMELTRYSLTASRLGLRLHEERGLPLARYRCDQCGHESFEGWSPGGWTSATARFAHRLASERV